MQGKLTLVEACDAKPEPMPKGFRFTPNMMVLEACRLFGQDPFGDWWKNRTDDEQAILFEYVMVVRRIGG